MKLNPFIKNKKDKDMNPKEKETAKEQELNAENLADEQLQDTENTEEAAPLTKEEELGSLTYPIHLAECQFRASTCSCFSSLANQIGRAHV